MGRPNDSWVALGPLKGQNSTDSPLTLGSGWATRTLNVVLDPAGAIAARRTGARTTPAPGSSLGPSPSAGGTYLIAYHLPRGATLEDAELWCFKTGGAGTGWEAWTDTGGGASFTKMFDTAGRVHRALSFNGKLFLAMETAGTNRMYVVDGGALRFVGLGVSVAPTVANTGAGAYPAVPRFYKVDWVYITSSRTESRSELSPAVSFTPSGAGTAARVTKPATLEHATHWRVWGSDVEGGPYHNISGNIAVGTTTYDDSATPSLYTGDFPEPVGTFLPPPSVLRVITDGNRLLLCGKGTTDAVASTGETEPRTNRVWYTPVLGTLDQGDDERIPNNGVQRNFLDITDPPIGDLTEIEGPMNGNIFAFAKTFATRLVPTGDLTTPYVAYPVTGSFGSGEQWGTPPALAPQRHVALGQTETGAAALYFVDESQGMFRITGNNDVQLVSRDIQTDVDAFRPIDASMVVFSFPRAEQTWWFVPGFQSGATARPSRIYIFHWRFGRTENGEVRGGWTTWEVAGLQNLSALALWNRTPQDVQLIGRELVPYACNGESDTVQALYKFDDSTTLGVDGSSIFASGLAALTKYQAYITAAPILATGAQALIRVGNPVLVATPAEGVNLRVTASKDFGAETRFANVQISPNGNATRVVRTVEGLFDGDVTALEITVGDALPTDCVWQIDLVTVPVSRQEPR